MDLGHTNDRCRRWTRDAQSAIDNLENRPTSCKGKRGGGEEMVTAVDSLQITAKTATPTRREAASAEAFPKETLAIPPIEFRLQETFEIVAQLFFDTKTAALLHCTK
jgi:hypothetical protein